MNRNNRAKHAILYLRQGAISLILLILTVYLGMVSSLSQTLFPYGVSDISQLSSESFVEEHPMIQIHCDELYYTGYDNYNSKEEVTGHYYYTIQDHYCMFVLLDKSEKAPEEMIKNFKGTLKITKDESAFNDLTQNLALDMEWSARSLQGITLPVIVSQPDYHFVPTVVLVVGLVICSLIFGYGTISNFYYYFRYF